MLMALYVPLDVDFASDPKFLAAGPAAGYLYISSLALAKRTMSDGVIDRTQLAVIAIGIAKPEPLAARLVDVGLWAETSSGWAIVSWLKRNMSRADIEAKSAKKSAGGSKGNHVRWHLDEGKPSPTCRYCIAEGIAVPIPMRSPEVEVEPKVETEAEASDAIDPAVEAELRRRLTERRRRGEDIGPRLEQMIRADVVRDLSLKAEDGTPKCAECGGRFSHGTGWLHASDCSEPRRQSA